MDAMPHSKAKSEENCYPDRARQCQKFSLGQKRWLVTVDQKINPETRHRINVKQAEGLP